MCIELPSDLADLPPGPALAAVLGEVDLAVVPNDRMLEVLTAHYRQLCHEQARMAAVLAELTRCEGFTGPGVVARLDSPDRYAPDETRAALAWTRAAADAEHDLAEHVVTGLPQLHTAWRAGLVDRPRVRVFDRYLLGLAREQAEAICEIAVPRAPRLTTGQLAVLLRRLVLAVDPHAAERWYRKGVLDRDLVAVMAPDGTVTMIATGLPADQAEAACVRVQDLAAAVKRAGHPGRIGQIRTDLFLGLLDGRFHGCTPDAITVALLDDARAADRDGRRYDTASPDTASPTSGTVSRSGGTATSDAPTARATTTGTTATEILTNRARERATTGARAAARTGTVAAATGGAGQAAAAGPSHGIEIRVALSTLLGRDEQPGEIPGLGLLPAPDARARVALQRRAEWRFAVTDSDGRLLSEGSTRRRPAAVGGHPVRGDGPRGGIVEIQVSDTQLTTLLGTDLTAGWAGVLTDIAGQHAERDTHLADLDARPGERLPCAALRRHTQIRDRTCRFPGCRRPARHSDIDHTHDHAAGGVTTSANTGPVCDHDHDVKHRAGWRLTQPEPGEFRWHSPLGGRYHTRGEFLPPPMPRPVRGDLGPDPVPTGRRHEGPILQPRRPVQAPRPPPVATELPGEPSF